LLIVSDYPGATEDQYGRPFAGGAGQYLVGILRKQGLDLEADCWSTNALICYSLDKTLPKDAVSDCRPNLLRAVRELNPTSILLAGGLAVESYLGHVWKPDPGSLARWVGRTIPCQVPNLWITCTHNPTFILRQKTDQPTRDQFIEDVARAARVARSGRPWEAVPDYRKQVRLIYDPGQVIRELDKIRQGVVAFDYETTTLKPDGPDAAIYSAAVCHEGHTTISFPWTEQIVPSFRRLVTDPKIGLIASNLDMEDRWSRRFLGVEVTNWIWDTMLASHCLDPRPGGREKEDGTPVGAGTTGLKFQAFARLGQPDYNHHLEDHLRPENPGGNSPNRIRSLPTATLLTYGGLDALLEYLVALEQAEEIGVTLQCL
jgi:uracil-DNA glycosylase family 4